jgi:hypothetical protein
MRASVRGLIVLAASSALLTGCSGPTVDLKQALEFNIVSSGWYDVGIVDGKNKLVPTVSFTVKNLSDQPLLSLQVMASFFRVTDPGEWGNNLVKATTGSDALDPGETTPTLTIRSPLGYTGTEPRLDMLKNSAFVDATVKLISKYGATQWTHVREVPIERQLVTQ